MKKVAGCYIEIRYPDHEKYLADQAQNLDLKQMICANNNEVQQYEPEVEVNVAGWRRLYLDDCHISTTEFMHAMDHYLQDAGVSFY